MPRKGEVVDLTGRVFGRLTVVRLAGFKHRHAVWECACECGKVVSVYRGCLVKGTSSSCGCVRVEQLVARNIERTTHGQSSSRTYSSWRAMWARCRGSSSIVDYYNYVLRGITVCDRWLSFENFLADMGERPLKTSIDRIDNDGNYEPGNCRWATAGEQAANQRRALTRGAKRIVLMKPAA